MAFSWPQRAELGQLLAGRSVTLGEFELAGGQTASVYVDVKQTVLTGRGADLIGRGLWRRITQRCPNAQAAGGLTVGADPLVTAISMAAWAQNKRDFGAIIVRKTPKSHGTARGLEAPATLADGAEVVAVDDVVTTGGSTMTAVERIRAAGFEVDHALCVVDRQSGGAERLADADVQLHPLFRLDDLLGFCR